MREQNRVPWYVVAWRLPWWVLAYTLIALLTAVSFIGWGRGNARDTWAQNT